MGFIPQINTKTLYAYLTQKGREYILNRDKEDFQIAYFTLHDEDVNYYISSNISAGTTYYTLQSGFIPDITGDADTCIKSIAAGTGINTMSSLSGSTVIDPVTGKPTVGTLGTDGTINGRNLSVNIAGSKNVTIPNIITNIQSNTQINITLNPPTGDSVAVTPLEIRNSQFALRITNVLNASICTFRVNNRTIQPNQDTIINPSTSTNTLNISLISDTAGLNDTTIIFDISVTPVTTLLNAGQDSIVRYTTKLRGSANQSTNTD